jgi:hypothetical protein
VNATGNINHGDETQHRSPNEAVRYAAHNLSIFPVRADKRPLVSHWRHDATSDPATIEAWWLKWPHADAALAVPASMLVVDIDVKHGKDGYTDFKRLAGYHPRDVLTPQSSTPSGGLHVYFRASKPYKNAVSVHGTGIDLRSAGGYVLLPLSHNGRRWLRSLFDTPLAPAPAWLDCALRTAPLTLAPRTAIARPTSDLWAQKKALAELERACARIVAAPCGAQDMTRHAQCFYVGGLVARGDLDYAVAYEALLAAANAMPAYRDPWRNLETRVSRSLEAGIGRPLALSETESWMREFRARMRLRRPTTSIGVRNG